MSFRNPVHMVSMAVETHDKSAIQRDRQCLRGRVSIWQHPAFEGGGRFLKGRHNSFTREGQTQPRRDRFDFLHTSKVRNSPQFKNSIICWRRYILRERVRHMHLHLHLCLDQQHKTKAPVFLIVRKIDWWITQVGMWPVLVPNFWQHSGNKAAKTHKWKLFSEGADWTAGKYLKDRLNPMVQWRFEWPSDYQQFPLSTAAIGKWMLMENLLYIHILF